MTTFIQKKDRVFRERGDIHIQARRSFARLKSINSCADLRVWASNDEERRQHILEILKDRDKKFNSQLQTQSLGKYIPIEILIDLLLSNKNSEIEKLKKQICDLQKLLEAYEQLDLTDEQKRKIQCVKLQISCAKESTSTLSYYDTIGDDDDSVSESTQYEAPPYADCGEPKKAEPKSSKKKSECPAINLNLDVQGSTEIEIELADMDGSFSTIKHYESMSPSELKCLLLKKDNEISNIKCQLSQVLKKCSDSEKCADLEKQLTYSKLALANAKKEKACLAKAICSTTKPKLCQLEKEIKCMRGNPNLSPEEETEVIRKELDVLKRYCDKLSNIQEENECLKIQNEKLKEKLACNKPDTGTIQQQANMLEKVLCEKKALQEEIKRLKVLECDIQKIKRELEVARNESCALMQELNEANRMKRQSNCLIENMKVEKEEMNRTITRLQSQLDENRYKLTQVQQLESCCQELQQQIGNLQCANQKSQFTISQMNEEVGCLKRKAQEVDCLLLERDRLKLRVQELCGLEMEVLQLSEQINKASVERDVYKRQNCELNGIIADQEQEIKSLLKHVDSLSQKCDEQQGKIKITLDEMQQELEKHNLLGLNGGTDKENELRCMIEDMKKKLNEKNEEIKILQKRLCNIGGGGGAGADKKLKDSCNDEHVRDLLHESHKAMGAVVSEFVNNCADDQHLRQENIQLKKHFTELQNLATKRIESLRDQLLSAQNDNCNLRCENEKLKVMAQGMPLLVH